MRRQKVLPQLMQSWFQLDPSRAERVQQIVLVGGIVIRVEDIQLLQQESQCSPGGRRILLHFIQKFSKHHSKGDLFRHVWPSSLKEKEFETQIMSEPRPDATIPLVISSPAMNRNRQAFMDPDQFSKRTPAEQLVYLSRWQLIVSVVTLLCVFVMVVLVAVVTSRMLSLLNTANNIAENVRDSGMVDNMSLMLNDVWFTVYPRIREGVALGYQLVQSANNNNITLLINGLVGDASNIGRFIHTILNLAANQYVAQQTNP